MNSLSAIVEPEGVPIALVAVGGGTTTLPEFGERFPAAEARALVWHDTRRPDLLHGRCMPAWRAL